MLTEAVSILGLFGTSALIANYFLTSWQQRNWFNQQQFSSAAKDFSDICSIFDDLTRLSSQRHARMLRLAGLMNSEMSLFEEATAKYRESVLDWNDKLPKFISSLTMYVSFEIAQRFEAEIQYNFYVLGKRLETLVRMRLAGLTPSRRQTSKVTLKLNEFGGLLRNFHKRLLIIQGQQQEITYHGVLLNYDIADLKWHSSWYLFKALFVSDIQTLGVVRSSPNLFGPLVSRGHGPGVNKVGRD